MKSKISGLAVWDVTVNHRYPPDQSSRVTTTLLIAAHWKAGISKVVAKAERFILQNSNDYPDAIIRGAQRKGVLDA
jgi:hypothetical protein